MPLDELNDIQLTSADWPPLDRSLMGDSRPAPVSFPLHLLPGRWRAWVEAASRPFGSADYLAQCLLAAVSGVCGAGVRAAVAPHWREPLLLWSALVGGPSSGKSASFARARTLLAEVAPWPDAKERSTDRAAPSVLVEAGLAEADAELFLSSRGVLLWREDLGGWMDEARRRAERPSWLAAWNAGPARVALCLQPSFAVGVAGALSLERLAAFADGDSALAARFLYVWPQPASVASLSDAEADDVEIVALLQKIANFAGHRESPAVVPLDEAATVRLEGLMIELRRRAESAEGVEAEWIAKGVSTVVRLAALLSLMQWADESPSAWEPVGIEHIETAYMLWSDYYLPQARAVFDQVGIAGRDRAARKVARWLKRLGSAEISREEVRRDALCQTVDAEGAEEILARLEAGGVVRPVVTRPDGAGRPRRRWLVNPNFRNSR